MLNIKVIEILLGVLLTLMIFQIYFKSFKTVSDKQILFVLILVLLCDKLFNRSKKEHSTSDLAPVTVDGAAAVFDADAFDNLNKIVKALAGEGTITIPGNVIIEGTLEVKGDKVDFSTIGLQFDKSSDGFTTMVPKNWDFRIGRPEGNKIYIIHGNPEKSELICRNLTVNHEGFIKYTKTDELKRWNNANNVILLKHKLMQSNYVWDRRTSDNRAVLKHIGNYGNNYANDPPETMNT